MVTMADRGSKSALASSPIFCTEDFDTTLSAEELVTQVETSSYIATHPLQVYVHRTSGRLFADELIAVDEYPFGADERDLGDLLLQPRNEYDFKKIRVSVYLKAVEQLRSLKRWRSCAIGRKWWCDANERARDLFWTWFRREEQCDELCEVLKELCCKYLNWLCVGLFVRFAVEALYRREVGVFYACMNSFPNELLVDIYYKLRTTNMEKFNVVFPLSLQDVKSKTRHECEIMRRNVVYALNYFRVFSLKTVQPLTSTVSASRPAKEVWPFEYCMWTMFNQSADRVFT